MTDPEKATIGDLFRLMTEMRGDLGSVKDDLASVKATVESHTAKLDQHTATLDDHSSKLDQLGGELQAVRDVVDNELASHGQVVALEGHLQEVLRTQRKQGKHLDVLTAEVRGSKENV